MKNMRLLWAILIGLTLLAMPTVAAEREKPQPQKEKQARVCYRIITKGERPPRTWISEEEATDIMQALWAGPSDVGDYKMQSKKMHHKECHAPSSH